MSISTRLLPGSELRRLLVLRSRLRDEIVGLPRHIQREVLAALERGRRQRPHGQEKDWSPPAMTPGELIREIKWRVDAAPLADCVAAAMVLDRARHRTARPRRREANRVRSRRR
jgi:hypothetical protein